MACFIVPATEAIVTTVVNKFVKKNEKKVEAIKLDHEEISAKIPFSRKLSWLNNLLWGGSALLAFEHVWHGEVTPWFPFLTAAGSPAEASGMLHEMATTGVGMAVLVTLVWAGMLAVSSVMEKKAEKKALADKEA